MKKTIAICAVVLVFSLIFAGCCQRQKDMQALEELAQTGEKLQEVYETGSQEEIAKAEAEAAGDYMDVYMEGLMEKGAQYELKEYEQTEGIDAPEGFPGELIYKNGKITEASDSSDAYYINKSITIKTTDELKTVKDHYKNLLSGSLWTIDSQSTEAYGASYSAVNQNTGLEVDVDIYSDMYSKLVSVSVYCMGDK
ncbi:MAG: hypothetical protein ABH856_01545 [Patescibacteria group bacterium]|nr:hypothetical protein [Patescibacteria group bacterium]